MLPVADSSTIVPRRVSYARIAEKREIPDLIELQVRSFAWFVDKGLRELFDEISPIRDFTSKVMELQFLDYEFGDPKYSELECRTRDLTFSRPLYVQVELLIKETGEIQRQRVYMGDYPWMTHLGTFIINGAERVVVSQLVRSPGVYYGKVEDPVSGRDLFTAKVIPNRGAWLEFETAARGDLLSVKVDRKRKIAATTLLRAVGYERNDEIAALFTAVDDGVEHQYIASTLDKDPTNTQAEALIEVYKKLRPGDPPTGDNARQLVESLFFNFRRYDLGRVGRYKFNKKLDAVGRRPLQVQQEAHPVRPDGDRAAARGRREPAAGPHDHQGGHRGHRRPADRPQQRPRPGRRHRPPRQPADPGQRGADPERLPHRPPAHGARRPRADDDPGDREGDPQRPHQHPPGGGGDEGVLRRQPAQPVHGPDEPAGRAHQQAAPLGPGARRPLARARRLRRPRRPPQPLRPDLPDRDPRGSEHRPDRLAGDVRPDQRLRLHRDAVPQGQAHRRLGRPRADVVHGRGRPHHEGRRGRASRRASRSPRPATPSSRSRRPRPSRSAPSSPTRSSTSPPTRRRSTGSPRRTPRSTSRATSCRTASRAATATSSPRSRRTASSTWTSARSRSSRSPRR